MIKHYFAITTLIIQLTYQLTLCRKPLSQPVMKMLSQVERETMQDGCPFRLSHLKRIKDRE